MNEEKISKRIFTIDLCCIIGIMLMIGLHFFQKSGFESVTFTSPITVASLSLRWLCMTGLPLLFTVNGAMLTKDKNFSFVSYKSFAKLAYYYIICFIIVTCYNNDIANIKQSLQNFYQFDGASFGVTYATLLFISPFLALAYNSLPDKKSKKILLGVMAVITSLPSVSIILNVGILPNYFYSLYPITLFFMGAYIYEYRKTFKATNFIVLLICICLSQGIFSYSDSINSDTITFFCDVLNSYWSLPTILATGCLFIALCKINVKNLYVKNVTSYIAKGIFPIIMISWIFEERILSLLIGDNEITDTSIMRFLPLYLLITIFICIISSAIIHAPFYLIAANIHNKENCIEEIDVEQAIVEEENNSEEVEFIPEQTIQEENLNSQNNYTINNETCFENTKTETFEQDYCPIPEEETPRQYYVKKAPVRQNVEVKPAPTLDSILAERTGYKSKSSQNIDDLIELISKN